MVESLLGLGALMLIDAWNFISRKGPDIWDNIYSFFVLLLSTLYIDQNDRKVVAPTLDVVRSKRNKDISTLWVLRLPWSNSRRSTILFPGNEQSLFV